MLKNPTDTGRHNVFTGEFVSEENEFDYAIEHCVKTVPEGFRKIEWTKDFKEMLVEWFYSDDWIKED